MAVMPGSRQALLDAADRLRHREPGRALGAREIAREAGVNHSLLFRHFGSVSGLLLELETSSFGELERSMAEATSTEELASAMVAAFVTHRSVLAISTSRGLEMDGAVGELTELRAPLARALVRLKCSSPAVASERAELVMAALAGMVVLVGADVTPPSGALETALLALLQVGDAGDGAAHPLTPFV